MCFHLALQTSSKEKRSGSVLANEQSGQDHNSYLWALILPKQKSGEYSWLWNPFCITFLSRSSIWKASTRYRAGSGALRSAVGWGSLSVAPEFSKRTRSRGPWTKAQKGPSAAPRGSASVKTTQHEAGKAHSADQVTGPSSRFGTATPEVEAKGMILQQGMKRKSWPDPG